jgi:asparagine synthase (glutamine-hydrolysing)
MLAYLLGTRTLAPGIEQRAGASLGIFAGVTLKPWRNGDRLAWQLPRVGDLPPRSQRARLVATHLACRPAVLPCGSVALVHGWIDNCAELAAELGCSPHDPALIYGHAVKRWGDAADVRVLGGYCAVFDDPSQPGLRLARSPLYGPPLYYAADDAGVAASSVPRVLEAIGLPRELNPQRLVDSMFFSFAEPESYLKGCFKVPYGAVVHVTANRRRIHRFYDPMAIKPLPKAPVEDYIQEADRLLTEACTRYQASAHNAGVLLTGGLDSANVAARLLRSRSPGARLHAFTYVPLEGHGQPELAGGLIDEGPAVREYAAMHPSLDLHLVDNREFEFDHRLEDMFLAMGTGTVNLAAFFRYHGLFTAAREAGCDMLLSADNGNSTFSASGSWAFAEYLRKGRLIQLWRALRGDRLHPKPLPWRFFSRAVVPLLPDPLWRLAMRLRGNDPRPVNRAISAVRDDALAKWNAEDRSRQAGTLFERTSFASRRDLVRDNFGRGDVEGSDMIQGWEQLYEVSMRDPTSYRPLVDFCLGLPTDMFMRDGETRWLARQLGRGLMPEAQRTMPGHGEHNSDWHMRLTPRLDDMRREVAAIRADPVLAEIIDTDLLERDLDNWPAAQSVDPDIYFPHAFRLPRAIAMGRYVRFMTGRNPQS